MSRILELKYLFEKETFLAFTTFNEKLSHEGRNGLLPLFCTKEDTFSAWIFYVNLAIPSCVSLSSSRRKPINLALFAAGSVIPNSLPQMRGPQATSISPPFLAYFLIALFLCGCGCEARFMWWSMAPKNYHPLVAAAEAAGSESPSSPAVFYSDRLSRRSPAPFVLTDERKREAAVSDAIKYLQAMDKYYSQAARPR